MADEPFPLDRVENPHPDLTHKALQYRRIARVAGPIPNDIPPEVVIAIGWLFYRDAMIDAGGWRALDMERWLDRREAENPLPCRVSVPVELRTRR